MTYDKHNRLLATSLKVFCSEESSSRGRIEIVQLVADWLIRLPIRKCVKPPVTSDCSLAPKLLFVDWLKILANEKQAVQFRSIIVLVCEQKWCSHMTILFLSSLFIGSLCPGGHRRAPLFDLALWNMYDQTIGDLPRTNNAAEGWH